MLIYAYLVGLASVLGGSDATSHEITLKYMQRPSMWANMSVGVFVPIDSSRPSCVKKEPAYDGSPRYGQFYLGDGPEALYTFSLTEKEDGECRIYLDKNRNGDLTDDGSSKWDQVEEIMLGDQPALSYSSPVTLKGSWQGELGCVETMITLAHTQYRPDILVNIRSMREGSIKIGDKEHAVMVSEMVRAVVPEEYADEPLYAERPPLFMIDRNGNKQFLNNDQDRKNDEIMRMTEAFYLEGLSFEANFDSSKNKLTFKPSVREVAPDYERPKLLPIQSKAPDFEAEAWGGGKVKLSDYRGKIVILDFWATWCNACKAGMPKLSELVEQLSDQDVVVLAICTGDTKDKYSAWVPTREDRYHFDFAYDTDSDVAQTYVAKLLPTQYVIDRDGTILTAHTGGGARVNIETLEALKQAGVKLPDGF